MSIAGRRKWLLPLALVAVALAWLLRTRRPIQPKPLFDFNLTPEAVTRQVEQAIAEHGQTLNQVLSLPQVSFASVIERLACAEARLKMATAAPIFLQRVSQQAEVREASVEAAKLLDRHEIALRAHEGLFALTKQVAAGVKPGELDAESQRLLEKLLLGYRRMGLDLPDKERARFKAIKERLAVLETDFAVALVEDRTTLLFTRAELEGCSEDYLAGLERREDDRLVVTMKYPDVYGALRMAKSAETRRLVEAAFTGRCPGNLDRLEEAIRLRAEAAHLLGYPTHAHYQLEVAMAKTPEKLLQFETDLQTKLMPLAKANLARLLEYKAGETGETNPTINSWDVEYYTRLLLEREYKVDQEQVKEYFPLEHVVAQMLAIYEESLGLRFERLVEAPTWHADVQAYAVRDQTTGSLMGHFYLDLFPREGKYTHAACFPLQPGHTDAQGRRVSPATAIVANFSKPLPDKPSLLKHDEVETLFHELGHSLHDLCSVTRYSYFHGFNTERDYLEAPSQLLENWVWDEASLQRLTKHYAHGTPMPKALIEQLLASRRVSAVASYLRQIFLALFDLRIHSISVDGLGESVSSLYARLRAEVTLIKQPPEVHPAATFVHMMAGYDVGYYGYLWSEVYAHDIFASRFQAEGLQNPATGLAYRRSILQPGGSREGMQSLIEFLGREPKQKAFLAYLGLRDN